MKSTFNNLATFSAMVALRVTPMLRFFYLIGLASGSTFSLCTATDRLIQGISSWDQEKMSALFLRNLTRRSLSSLGNVAPTWVAFSGPRMRINSNSSADGMFFSSLVTLSVTSLFDFSSGVNLFAAEPDLGCFPQTSIVHTDNSPKES